MGKIFYVMGKSASGKDTVFKHLRERLPQLKTMTMYTTRPIRDGEQEGVEYYFVDQAYLERCRERGTLIECRTYDTVLGPWSYFTADDGQIRLEHGDYLMIGTLESYGRMKEFYGTDALVPIYIYVEDGLRLQRALERERQQKEPKYGELCRRFLADEVDFKKENLELQGIKKWYENLELEACLKEIVKDIQNVLDANV
ncbi:MAG: guanylate kinase [Clostridium sp.]|nr:guanylate kinase [Clostridium sp.]